jgi:hypothetical protein
LGGAPLGKLEPGPVGFGVASLFEAGDQLGGEVLPFIGRQLERVCEQGLGTRGHRE